ncbi:Uncharacterized protein BP5553_07042 [Venustampulla echinocandica]|uniref:Uncharacterized protein n=1 Tax=Venustampulla echinocandica TaxID=2656787 RepID=A0A370TIC2_9HELO|nr:Uncharacterized protein BP5553_07042 [Venustampulla echinocandica]RDL35111.1 Uncharacterized protein BP5553_07042 [Venustampulla echinocandica]
MAATPSLDSSIHLPVTSVETKHEILRHLWDFDVCPSHFYDIYHDYDAYFSYYTEQCSDALHDGGRHVSVRTHNDIVQIAQHLKNSVNRNSVRQILGYELPLPKPANEDELLDGSIDLVARLLLMVEFGCLQYGFTGRRQVGWVEGSLGECMTKYFGAPQILEQETVRFEKVFNARNLGQIAGIKIRWTNNLADHLRLVDDVSIDANFSSNLFPVGLVDETLRTLALLFPGTDKTTKKWFKKLSTSKKLDTKAVKCGRLRAEDRYIENFEFWHDRLIVLKQLFDEAEPDTFPRWWYDRRRRVQWYTFWIAALVLVLTIFFGIVQSIEGGLQVYKAYNPS